MAIDKYNFSDNDKRIESLRVKKLHYKIKVTSYIDSQLKEDFIDDCLNKKSVESQTVRSILDIYYKEILPLIPRNEYMDFVKIKQYINDNIKLK